MESSRTFTIALILFFVVGAFASLRELKLLARHNRKLFGRTRRRGRLSRVDYLSDRVRCCLFLTATLVAALGSLISIFPRFIGNEFVAKSPVIPSSDVQTGCVLESAEKASFTAVSISSSDSNSSSEKSAQTVEVVFMREIPSRVSDFEENLTF
jgi:hypothetical protein